MFKLLPAVGPSSDSLVPEVVSAEGSSRPQSLEMERRILLPVPWSTVRVFSVLDALSLVQGNIRSENKCGSAKYCSRLRSLVWLDWKCTFFLFLLSNAIQLI